MDKQQLKIIPINTWNEFKEKIDGKEFRNWAFRGQADLTWPLFSSLSRYLLKFKVDAAAWPQQEKRILRIFKRKAHHYLNHLPEDANSLEWLALMQHHGAPTRLLDFTWSPYVAAFFALENANTPSAIWAIYPPKTYPRDLITIYTGQITDSDNINPQIPGNFEKYFISNTANIVSVGEPRKMNLRLIAQSGTFAVPGVLHIPLDEILLKNKYSQSAIIKFELNTQALRRTAMEDLYKMNITNATLFPDVDGLARSLAFELEFHWAFDPVSMEKNPDYFID